MNELTRRLASCLLDNDLSVRRFVSLGCRCGCTPDVYEDIEHTELQGMLTEVIREFEKDWEEEHRDPEFKEENTRSIKI
jgi:hypothetical protein